MVDPPLIAGIKRVMRAVWELQLALHRRGLERKGAIAFELAGSCEGCAKCCEAPSIATGPLVFLLRPVERVFLWWQARVNGFELTSKDREGYAYTFRCTHFDAKSRRCDSYATRPGMCRDYPRIQLEQPRPDLFEGCGYRPRLKNAESMLVQLGRPGITDAQREKLKKDLFLE